MLRVKCHLPLQNKVLAKLVHQRLRDGYTYRFSLVEYNRKKIPVEAVGVYYFFWRSRVHRVEVRAYRHREYKQQRLRKIGDFVLLCFLIGQVTVDL